MTADPTKSTWYAGRRLAAYGLVAGAALIGAVTPATAEDLRGRWYFGGNLAFLSTTDDIRPNAAINLGDPGDDGIPNTGDPNEDIECSDTGEISIWCDPRPDHLLSREMTIEETFKLDFTAGYGLTSWLSLQVDASYFKGDVGPVDAFTRQFYPADPNPQDENLVPTTMARSEESFPVAAGEITEIPVSITGVVRFRKDSTLNPYVGIGAGIIFAQMDVGGDVGALNSRLSSMRIASVNNEWGDNITPPGGSISEFTVPFTFPLVVDVDDAFEWHLVGGAEYFFNDRVSMVFDAKYMFADQSVSLLLGDQDQIVMAGLPENLFRKDGSLKYFVGQPGGGVSDPPNPFCVDSPNAPILGGQGEFGCPVAPSPTTRVSCEPGQVGDFDGSGLISGDPDICYNKVIHSEPNHPFSGLERPYAETVVQGGEIDLTGLSIAVGVRFHF